MDKTGLIIPNKEIQWIFSWQIHAWFREKTIRNTDRLERFSGALQENDVAAESAMIIENLSTASNPFRKAALPLVK